MAGAKLAAVPMVSGASMASPTQGQPTGFSELIGAFSPEFQRELQLKKQQEQEAILQASQARRQQILQQLMSHPELAGNAQLQNQLKQMYQGTGIQAPIDPAQKATQGTPAVPGQSLWQTPGMGGMIPGTGKPATPGTQARGPQIDIAALSGNTFPEYVQKNYKEIIETPPQQRAEAARAQGINLTPDQAKALESFTYQPSKDMITAQDNERTTTRQLLKEAVGSGSYDRLKAAVDQFQRAAPGLQMDPTQFNGYLNEAISQMSPMQVEKMKLSIAQAKKLGEDTTVMEQMLQPRIDAIQEQTKERAKMITHLQNVDASLKALTGPRASLYNNQAQKAIDDAMVDFSRSDLYSQEADFYAARVASGQLDPTGADTKMAMSSLTAGRDGAQRMYSSLQTAVNAIKKDPLYGIDDDATAKDNARIKELMPLINQTAQQINNYNTQLQSIVNPTGAPNGIQFPMLPVTSDDNSASAGGGSATPKPAASNLPKPSKEEAAKLKPGTKFIGPDGKTYVKTPQGAQAI